MGKKRLSDIDDFLLPNHLLCGTIGMVPLDGHPRSIVYRLSIYFRIIFAVIAINSVFIPEILDIAVNWGDLRVLTSVGCVTTTVGQLLIKIIYLLARGKRISRMYVVMRELWMSSEDPDERKSFEQYAKQAKIFTIAFFFSGSMNVITFATAAVVLWIDVAKTNATDYIGLLPFAVWYGPQDLNSPKFEIAFACQSLAAVICCIGITGLDATMMTLMFHACGQFALINTWIRGIGAKIEKQKRFQGELDQMFLHEIRKNIAKCVNHHQQMLCVIEEVDTLLNPIILMQFLTSGIEICLSGFAVTNSGTSGTDLIKFSCYLASMVLQLIVWCWPGEILIAQSLAIGENVYLNLSWYDLDPESRKDLILIIVRSHKHCQITAGKIKPMSLNTLSSIFNTAVSYFTLLRRIQMDD